MERQVHIVEDIVSCFFDGGEKELEAPDKDNRDEDGLQGKDDGIGIGLYGKEQTLQCLGRG
jgi:hypothetical protein